MPTCVRYMMELPYVLSFIFYYATLNVFVLAITYLIREQFYVLTQCLEKETSPSSGDNPEPIPLDSFVRDHQALLRLGPNTYSQLLHKYIGFLQD